jgi:hypothetical protein
VAWVHVDNTDIQNLSLDLINVVEPRVTKTVVVVAPPNNGKDVESRRWLNRYDTRSSITKCADSCEFKLYRLSSVYSTITSTMTADDHL